MRKIFIADLKDNTTVESIFLVASKSVRETKNGDPYLCITCQDKTGTIEARVWDNALALEARFQVDDFIAARGRVSSFRDELQLTLSDLDRIDEEGIDLKDFLPHSRWSADALFRSLETLIEEEVSSAEVRRFLKALFADPAFQKAYQRAPAAVTNHHNYLAGLLEHSLSMARLAIALGRHYQTYYPAMVDTDLLIAGCVIHDMGKVEELSFGRSFDYSTVGRLVGHIPIGSERVSEVARSMDPPLDPNLEMQLKHLVLSHHGRQEYGAPVIPRTAEATLLHFLDMIDSRMNMCWNATEEHLSAPNPREGWTDYLRVLSGSLYIGGDAASGWKGTDELANESGGPGVAPGPFVPASSKKERKPSLEEDKEARSDPNPNLSLFGE